MADSKISALPASTTPLAGTEVLPIVQSSTTKQVTVANLTAGRAVSATQLTLTTGNLIVANGQGVDFSSTPGTGTSELFADYEEGTFTGTLTASITPPLTPITATGYYTKVGRLVTASVAFRNVDNTGAVGQINITGLPFTSNSAAFAIGQMYMSRAGTGPLILDLSPSATQVAAVDSAGNGVSWASTGPFVYGTVQITYMV